MISMWHFNLISSASETSARFFRYFFHVNHWILLKKVCNFSNIACESDSHSMYLRASRYIHLINSRRSRQNRPRTQHHKQAYMRTAKELVLIITVNALPACSYIHDRTRKRLCIYTHYTLDSKPLWWYARYERSYTCNAASNKFARIRTYIYRWGTVIAALASSRLFFQDTS